MSDLNAEIKLLEAVVKRLEQGDLSARVSLPSLDKREDNIARLSRSLNRLAETLQTKALPPSSQTGRSLPYSLLESMEDGVLLMELPSSEVVMLNSAARHILDLGENEGRKLNRDNRPEAVLLELAKEAQSNPDASLEREFASGGRVARIRSVIERDPSGQPVRCLFTLVDVTREREVELLRDDLSSMIVHDLRTPLTTIIASLETLSSTEDQDVEARQELVGIGLSGARSLLGLVNTLLDISVLESGEVPLEKATVRLEELLESALAQISPLAKEAQLEIESDFIDVLPELQLDRDKIQRVLVNLLGNAVKFTPAGGKITVSICNDDARGWILVTVQDTGEGVPEEYHERIFDKFEQAVSHKEKRELSTGLGLTFCKLAVEAHGGRIWVESPLFVDEESGKPYGSRFTFTLPSGSSRNSS